MISDDLYYPILKETKLRSKEQIDVEKSAVGPTAFVMFGNYTIRLLLQI